MCKQVVPVALLVAISASLAGKDKPRNWKMGTVVEVSAAQAHTYDTTFTATDYKVQFEGKEYVLRPDPSTVSKASKGLILVPLVGVAMVGAQKEPSRAVPANVGDTIKFALEGSRAWVSGANGKEYACTVLHQTFISQPAATPAQPAPEPIPNAPRPAVTHPTPERVATPPRREIDPADRPTLRRETVSDTDSPMTQSDARVVATPEPELPALVRNYDSPPQVTFKREPEYSREARAAKIEGHVVLQIMVGSDGVPRDIRVVRSLGYGLDEKARDCVSSWRFQPGLKGGKPVPVAAYIEVNFHPVTELKEPLL